MIVNWVIENFSKENSFKELTEAVESLGFPLIKINGDYSKDILASLNKFDKGYEVGETTTNPVKIYNKNCVVVNGTIKMCKLIKEDLSIGNYPIIYSDFQKYKCSSYYSHFGPYLFNDKYCLMTLKELERQKFDIWGHYGKDSLIFIRPDDGDKPFQAGLLDLLDLSKFMDNHQDCLHDLVLVSTPKNIKWEGRFVCSKHKEIIAHSTYRYQGKVTQIPSVPEGATKFCNLVLNKVDYVPDAVFCLDLVEDSDNNYWLLELTSFSSAGLYACNKIDIVKRVSEIAYEDFTSYGKL